MTISDAALDFVGLHRTYERQFTEQVLIRYQNAVDAGFWQRIHFYLCYSPFSQLLYGSSSESETFIAQGIDGLRAMFGE